MITAKLPAALFLQGGAGKLLAVFYPPSSRRDRRHAILHVPAFAEEMNKSRRMVALQAVECAEQGYGVLVLDLFGTGDSEGDFGEARWEIWIEDLRTASVWLADRGFERISLWGLRCGALLAMDFAERSGNRFEHLILWQPALNGKNLVMQFLRLRVASALFAGEAKGKTETTADLRDRLLAGQPVEVAGYELGPDLVKRLMECRADRFEDYPFASVRLFELVSESGKAGSTANREWLASVKAKGLGIFHETVEGPAFWSTQEIAVVPGLIEKTTRALN